MSKPTIIPAQGIASSHPYRDHPLPLHSARAVALQPGNHQPLAPNCFIITTHHSQYFTAAILE